MAAFDLLVRGGRVVDPGQDMDERIDIGIAGGRVVAVDTSIPEGDAARVIDASGPDRVVVPGLLDIHAHVAYGATTAGVGMPCSEPDGAGVGSGVTTLVDAGSLGVSNFGVFASHILRDVATDVLCFLNVGSFAHTMPGRSDVESLDEVDADAIGLCIENNPGLVRGLKLRLVGQVMDDHGEALIDAATSVARTHDLPLMVHIGDRDAAARPRPERMRHHTADLLRKLRRGDILTHLCTPAVGGTGDDRSLIEPALLDARRRGVILDAAVGQGHLGYAIARDQYERGLYPDTISSDLTARTQRFHSLVECMAKFMAVGYTLADVVRMTTTNAAAAVGLGDVAGTIAVDRPADITILDVIAGDFEFRDGTMQPFRGRYGIAPILTIKRGVAFEPGPSTHEWGWLPARAHH